MANRTNENEIPVKEQEEQCFVIMPISSQNGYDEGHFQLVYEDIIKPSIIAAGLKPFRADETKNTNLIQLDILRNVVESTIAICDMSARNPNVFYELGMRQAFDLPTVLLRDEVTEAPFDVNGLRYVTYKKDMKHRDVVKAVQELTDALKDTYVKRNDKSEINSLIRLMELASPAKLSQMELSEEARYEKLNELHLKDIMSSIDTLNANQKAIFEELRESRSSSIYKKRFEEIMNDFALKKSEATKGNDNKYVITSSGDKIPLPQNIHKAIIS
ncbi:hypothetical protein [Shewanella woodyi]|uniref:hypothetical protein n=1 Tax=Shewanella woodyi TaxID=60961 RepID=UPI003748E7A7